MPLNPTTPWLWALEPGLVAVKYTYSLLFSSLRPHLSLSLLFSGRLLARGNDNSKQLSRQGEGSKWYLALRLPLLFGLCM